MNTGGLMTRESCIQLDTTDALSHFRDRFSLPQGVIYLDGNSLGAMPVDAPARAEQVITQQWGHDLIASWNTHDWFTLPQTSGHKISQIIGGEKGECVATDTTSINVYKALHAAVRIQREHDPSRRLIITERENFPTDIYIIEGLIDSLNASSHHYEMLLVDDAEHLKSVLKLRGNEVVCVLITQVNYRTGYMWNINEVTELVHNFEALMIWDLCHSAGAVPLRLDESGADFAVGCTYKYLNGGPGSPAYIWSAQKHLSHLSQPLTGWWGHASPFEMRQTYEPAAGATSLLVGTQPIISMQTMQAGLDIALEVDQAKLRDKSVALTTLFIELVEHRLADYGLTLVTPKEADQRGSHVSFEHAHAFAVVSALISHGVIGDYRDPGVMRFGFAPLYNSFTDVWDAVDIMHQVFATKEYEQPEFSRKGAVT